MKINIKPVKNFLKKNTTSGLTLIAMVGVVATAYFVSKESPEAKERLEDREDANTAEKIGIVIGSCPKSIAAGMVTITCIGAAHWLDHKEITALSAIAATQYKYITKENAAKKKVLSEEENHKVDQQLVEEYLFCPDESTAIRTGHGNILCLEKFTGHFFYSCQNHLLNSASKLNNLASKNKDEIIELSEWYREIGLPDSIISDTYGFPYDPEDSGTGIDICFGDGHTADGIPYLVVEYYNPPVEI